MTTYKFVLKNILENKFRGILIIFSVAVAGALLYASFGISNLLTESYLMKNYQLQGFSDIIIMSSSEKPDKLFFNPNDVISLCDDNAVGIDEYIFELNGVATYEKEKYNLHGLDIEGLNNLSKTTIKDEEVFEGYKIIISKAMAEKHGMKKNDDFSIYIKGMEYKFKIYCISEESVFFQENLEVESFVIPIETAREIYGVDSKINKIHLKYSDSKNAKDDLERLEKNLTNYNVQLTADEEEAQNRYKVYSTVFLITAIIASLMSLYIIFINFKVLIINKSQLLTIIRSLGGSIAKCTYILFLETIFYGLAGGIFAIIIGIIIQFGIRKVIIGFCNSINFSIKSAILTLLLTTIVCVFGGLWPILKSSRKRIIRNVDLELRDNNIKRNSIMFGIGLLLIALSFVLVNFSKNSFRIVSVVFGICGILFGIILIISFLVQIFSLLAVKIFEKYSKNVGILSVWGIRENEYFDNIIKICSVGIAIFIAISMIGTSCIKATKDAYSMFTSDGVLYVEKMDDEFVEKITNLDGVKDVYANYEIWNIKVKDIDTAIEVIDSVDNKKHSEFFDYNYSSNEDSLLNKLNEGKNIIISSVFANEANKVVGDNLVLEFKDKDATYKIIGIIDVSYNSGKYSLISKENMKEDANTMYYDRLYFNVNNNLNDTIDHISNIIDDNELWITSIEDRMKSNLISNTRIFTIINWFVILSALVATIGVINLLIMNAIQRKKELGIMLSIGMDKRFEKKYLLLEGLLIGNISGIFGSIGAASIITMIPYIYQAIGFPPIYTSISLSKYIIFIFIFSVISCIIVYLVNILMNRKEDFVVIVKENTY